MSRRRAELEPQGRDDIFRGPHDSPHERDRNGEGTNDWALRLARDRILEIGVDMANLFYCA